MHMSATHQSHQPTQASQLCNGCVDDNINNETDYFSYPLHINNPLSQYENSLHSMLH